MAYIPITEAQTNPEAPITAELMKQLRDNPIAIAEGLPNAPRIYLRSLEQLEPGNQIRRRRDESIQTQAPVGEPPVSATRISHTFLQWGVIRVSAEITSRVGSLSQMDFVRGDTVLATFTTTGVHTLDVSVSPGDVVSIRETGDAGPSGNITVQNRRFSTDGQDLWPGGSAVLEGNREP